MHGAILLELRANARDTGRSSRLHGIVGGGIAVVSLTESVVVLLVR